MNNPTRWAETRIDENSVRYTSEHTYNGNIVVTATRENDTIRWDNPDDVPVFIAEQAARTLGV
jgi:hypothetical protein